MSYNLIFTRAYGVCGRLVLLHVRGHTLPFLHKWSSIGSFINYLNHRLNQDYIMATDVLGFFFRHKQLD